jgi:hypothetical protein
MARVFVFACGALAMTGATGAADETTTVTRSVRGNYAEIIQSGPTDGTPAVEIKKGPGYVVIRQHSKNNKAMIIQSGGEQD